MCKCFYMDTNIFPLFPVEKECHFKVNYLLTLLPRSLKGRLFVVLLTYSFITYFSTLSYKSTRIS